MRGSHSERLEELFVEEVLERQASFDFYQVRGYGEHHVVV